MMENLLMILFCTCLVLTLTRSEDQETFGDCALPCTCRWVGGKKTANCEKLNYTYIPSYLSPVVQNLDLTGNNIKHLKENSFYDVGLVNLHKLILQDSNIHEIDSNAFKALKIIIEIDLSNNKLRELHPGTFDDTEKLRVLLMNNNNIKTLENNLFKNLEFMQRIEISNNHLHHIAEKTFINLPNFQTLIVDSNNLTILKVSNFEHLSKLHSLDLNNNPWTCDCNLKKFRNWTIHRKLYTKPTSCNEPSYLRDKMWDEVSDDEFACPPEILSVGPSKSIELIQGETITLTCHVNGSPKPTLSWSHNLKFVDNASIGMNHERKYMISEKNEWSNLTIMSVDMTSDRGDYVCVATNYAGIVKEAINLSIVESLAASRNALLNHLPILLGLGIVLLLLIVFLIILIAWWCKKKNVRHDEKSIEVTSLEHHHGLGEQEKSLITAVNPVVKPPRRYDAPSSVTSHGTDITEVNRTLLDNDSVFADGVGSVIGIAGGISEDDGEQACTPEADMMNSLTHGTNYRHYPPDLLAFSGIRGASPSSQSSIIPEQLNTTTRSLNHHIDYDSPLSSGKYPAAFKTLPHNRSTNNNNGIYGTAGTVILPRHGYVTIPRRPRAPSWSSGPPLSPVDVEPVYDRLGLRTTADGSSKLSLNKSPEPSYSMRMRPLPSTPTTPTKQLKTINNNNNNNNNTIQRSTPNILSDTSTIDRSAPEGAAEWTNKQEDVDNRSLSDANGTLGRKIPPRPPPKPKKKKTSNGPLYEDEGEDGTEV